MSKIVVADSSCLIVLSKTNKLSLLQALFGEVLIPEAVFHEAVTLGKGRPGAEAIQKAGWIKQVEAKDQLAIQTLKLTLGPGESEAIVLASEVQAEFVILDDRKARHVASELSLPVIGTIAILSKALEKGLIEDLQQAVNELLQAGFRFKAPKNG